MAATSVRSPTPQRLSVLLTLAAVAATLVFLGALGFVAYRLAAEFNASARADAAERVAGGLDSMAEDLSAAIVEYGAWTAHFRAVEAGDWAWLEENVGAAAHPEGVARMVVLGGGPLERIDGWPSDATVPQGPEAYAEALGFARAEAARQGHDAETGTLLFLRRLDGALWIFAMTPVLPHTEGVEVTGPTAQLLFGLPLAPVIAERLVGTLRLSGLEVQAGPGVALASHRLEVAGGPPAWLVWDLPSPGSDALRALALPVGLALAAVVAALGAGGWGVRRLALRLETALAAAEAASRTKSDFLANMSHEIRTPLNGVLGMADLLADSAPAPRQREMIEAIRQSGGVLLALVNDVLDLARVEAGKLSLDPQPFDLGALLARLESVHGTLAGQKGIELSVVCLPSAPGHRLGDAMRVLQILHNVIGNAVKFTEAGSVRLAVGAERAEEVVFRVRDSGIGMTEAQVARMFDAFEQAEAGIARRFGGTGLGMAIARRLVLQMGGTISVFSELGKGTEVTVRLPLPEVRTPPPGPAVVAEAEGPDDSTLFAGRLLLVAEDNATNRRLLALMLERLGLAAVFAENGAEACALVAERRFDLVLMDISMPVMDGVTALQQIRRDSAAAGRPAPPVVAATANVMRSQIDDYLAQGFVEVLPKPVRPAELRALLRRLLAAAPRG